MQMYFLLATAFPNVILGSPVAEGLIPTGENFKSFLPPQEDLASNPDQITYSDGALQLQSTNDQTSEPEFAALPADKQLQTGPNFAFDVALAAPHSQREKIDDDTAKYRGFNCQQRNSICCQSSDLSRDSNHKSCSEKNENQYAGHEDVGVKDLRYGQYCYNPFYTTACDDSLVTLLQDVKGTTCYTDCQITEVNPPVEKWNMDDMIDRIREGLGPLYNSHWRRF